MRDLLSDLHNFRAAGQKVGRAVVTSVWGSAPRAEGACMLAGTGGGIAGSVSGGCVEGATVSEILAAIERGTPKLVTFGVSDEAAWSVGLACGGIIRVLVEPDLSDRVLAAARGAGGVVVATVIEGWPESGEPPPSATIAEDGTVDVASRNAWLGAALGPARDAIRREASATVELPGPAGAPVTVFLECFPRQPRLVIVGAVHIAMALVPLARSLGYRTIVADGREAFLTEGRFPEADELVRAWPEEAFARIGLDRACYVAVLSHDPKFDEPALRLALRSEAPYIGAIGSRKTQRARRERLLAEGYSSADLDRLHGPIGLDLGGRTPTETALAIMAEITQVRYGARGR